MQSKSRPLDDLTNLMTNAMGAVKGVGDEVRAIGRSQAERIVADLDLVTRDEYEVLKSMLETYQAEVEALRKDINKLKKSAKKSA